MTRTVLVVHPGAELYGSDRMVAETVAGLVRAGCRVRVVLPAPGPLVDLLEASGAQVRVLAVPVLRRSALRPSGLVGLMTSAVRSAPAALRLLRRSEADVVYVSTLTQPSWLLLARLAGVPAVCHVHEAEASAPRLVRTALALPLLLARSVLANSRYCLDVAVGAVPALARRTVVVPNGVQGPPARLPDVAPMRRPGDPLEVLYVGRLSARKGVDVLLDAAAEAVARGVDVRVTLVGAVFPGYEEYEQRLRRLAGTGPLHGRVRFTGFDPDVWGAAARAHVWVVPARVDESFGNTAVEAVLAGRPLVASRTSGLREAAAGYSSAVLVEPGEPGALAAALVEVDRRWQERCAGIDADVAAARRRHAPEAYRRAVMTALGVPVPAAA